MTTMRLDDLRQYSDVLRTRDGEVVSVRFVEPRDAEALQTYFRSLTTPSRYKRFLGAASELPPSLLEEFIHIGEADRFSVIATMLVDGFETIVGEARYAFDSDTVERIEAKNAFVAKELAEWRSVATSTDFTE